MQYTPFITCVQYRGGFQYRGVFSTLGEYSKYLGGCSIPWQDIMIDVGGYHEYRGGYLKYRKGYSVLSGDIMMHVGDIMSTMGVFSTMGDAIFCNLSTMGDIMMHVEGYHKYRGECPVHPHGTDGMPPRES